MSAIFPKLVDADIIVLSSPVYFYSPTAQMKALIDRCLVNYRLIACTSCRYCAAGCPENISIPDLFAAMNTKQIHHDWNADYYCNMVHTANGKGKASDCVKSGKCEQACPQHLHIRDLLEDVAKEFEK